MRRKRDYAWLVKLNFLILALGMAVYGMYYLNHRNIEPALEQIGLVEASTLRKARLIYTKPASEASKLDKKTGNP